MFGTVGAAPVCRGYRMRSTESFRLNTQLHPPRPLTVVATRARRSWRPYARLSTNLTKQSRSREEKREKIRRAGRSSTPGATRAELRNNGASPVDQRAKLNEDRYTRPKRRTLSLRYAPECWCTSHGACLLRPGLWQSLEERQKPLRSRRLEIRSSGTEPRPEPECLSNSTPESVAN